MDHAARVTLVQRNGKPLDNGNAGEMQALKTRLSSSLKPSAVDVVDPKPLTDEKILLYV